MTFLQGNQALANAQAAYNGAIARRDEALANAQKALIDCNDKKAGLPPQFKVPPPPHLPFRPIPPGDTSGLLSEDPNELIGPAGSGAADFVAGDTILPYAIDFENDGTAPAQIVVVTQQLSPNLDLNTFQLGEFGFGSRPKSRSPRGSTSYSTESTLRFDCPGAGPDGLIVEVTAGLNLQTGLATWTFTSIEPTTLDVPSGNPLEGFLPRDDANGDGEGFVSYTIRPQARSSTGTAIGAQATVVFDSNAPINTQSTSNTIDATVPTSSIQALPATIISPSFTVSWSGSDGAGSGIASFDVFVSDNGGPFVPFQDATNATSAIFTGQVGHTYTFYSVATSNVGLVQPTPNTGQATTTLVNPPPPVPPVIIGEHAVFRRPTNKKGKPVGKAVLTGFTIEFSAPLNVASTTNAVNYELDTITTRKVKKKVVTTLHPITKFTVSYIPANDSVDLTLIGTQSFPTGGRLTIVNTPPGGVTGLSGALLAGTTVFAISKKGTTITPATL